MSWIAVGALVVPTLYQLNSSRQVARRQDSQLAQQIRTQAAHQQDADKAVSDLINKTAQSNDTGAQNQLQSNFIRAAQAAQGNATGGLNQVGNVSSAYQNSGADAALGISDYGKKVADLTSRIDAPGLQRQQEQTDRLRFGSQLGGISRDAEGDDFLAKLRLQQIRANPWGNAAANALGAYGSMKLINGLGNTDRKTGSVSYSGGYGTNLPF